MKIIVQRVSQASVTVDRQVIAGVGSGLLLLVGFGDPGDVAKLRPMAEKISNLRVFPNQHGKLDHSVLDVAGGILAVPQFTLYGNCNRGRRPDFSGALNPELASDLFVQFVAAIRSTEVERVEHGRFGAQMQVQLINDGPLTLILDSD